MLEHYVVEVRTLVQIHQIDYVRVTAHLQYLNFSSLLEDFEGFESIFLHNFNCIGHFVFLVLGQLDQPELSLPQHFAFLVEILEVQWSNCLWKHLGPLVSRSSRLEVKNPRFQRGKKDLYGKCYYLAGVWRTWVVFCVLLRGKLLYKSSS